MAVNPSSSQLSSILNRIRDDVDQDESLMTTHSIRQESGKPVTDWLAYDIRDVTAGNRPYSVGLDTQSTSAIQRQRCSADPAWRPRINWISPVRVCERKGELGIYDSNKR